MRVVVALGGNALLKRGERLTADNQRTNVRQAAPALAGVAENHELVLCEAFVLRHSADRFERLEG